MCHSCMFGDDSRTFYCSLHTIPPRETDGTQQWLPECFEKRIAIIALRSSFANFPTCHSPCSFADSSKILAWWRGQPASIHTFAIYILLVSGSSWFLKGCNCCGWSGKSWHICSRLIWLSHYCKVRMTWGLATRSVNGILIKILYIYRRIMETFGRLLIRGMNAGRVWTSSPAKWPQFSEGRAMVESGVQDATFQSVYPHVV